MDKNLPSPPKKYAVWSEIPLLSFIYLSAKLQINTKPLPNWTRMKVKVCHSVYNNLQYTDEAQTNDRNSVCQLCLDLTTLALLNEKGGEGGNPPKNKKENVGLGLLTVACTLSCLLLPNFFISKIKLKHKLGTFCAQTWMQLWDSSTFWESWLTNTHTTSTDKEKFCQLLTWTATTIIKADLPYKTNKWE
jgi:hypothetical protein